MNVFGSLINGLCQSGNTTALLKLHEELVNGTGEFGVICHLNVISYSSIINGLCKDGLVDKAKELFLDIKSR